MSLAANTPLTTETTAAITHARNWNTHPIVKASLSMILAVMAVSACGEKETSALPSQAPPTVDMQTHHWVPESHSLCDTVPDADIAKLAGKGAICTGSDTAAPGVIGETTYSSTDGSGKYVTLKMVDNPGEFDSDQRLAENGGFEQPNIAGHPAIYNNGELTIRLDSSKIFDIAAGTIVPGGTAPASDTPTTKADLIQIARDAIPNVS